jgi:hypothetical protein
LALAVGLAVVGFVYQAYFTHEKRAIRARLSEADAKCQAAVDARLKPLTDLFAKGRDNARAFADDALSWSGKWQFVKGLADGGRSHQLYLSECFARHVFSPDQFQAALEGVVRTYLDDVEAAEAEMLVRLRADLADSVRPDALPSLLRSNEEFRKEYAQLARTVKEQVLADLGVSVAQGVVSAVAAECATQVVLQAARAAAAELGVNAGILTAGAGATVATLGVGLVVAVVIDYLIAEAFKWAGYDPAAEVADQVRQSLRRMEEALLREPGFFSSETKGSLRQRLDDIHAARAQARRAAIYQLFNK